jgi:hypothetical protein
LRASFIAGTCGGPASRVPAVAGGAPMTATTPSTALVTVQLVFTESERLALAGFLAGYRRLIREAYTLDLRQFTAWCRTRSLSLFSVRRADIETFARELEARGRARATVTRRLCTIAGFCPPRPPRPSGAGYGTPRCPAVAPPRSPATPHAARQPLAHVRREKEPPIPVNRAIPLSHHPSLSKTWPVNPVNRQTREPVIPGQPILQQPPTLRGHTVSGQEAGQPDRQISPPAARQPNRAKPPCTCRLGIFQRRVTAEDASGNSRAALE